MEWMDQVPFMRDIIRPTLDILFLAFVVYQTYKILVQTRAIQLAKGVMFLLGVYGLAFFLQLSTLLWILNRLAPALVIIMAIVFQPELRNIFTQIGKGEWFSITQANRPYQIDTIINAVEVLAGRRRGCLIVFTRKVGLKNIVDSGTQLNAELSSSLVLTIFGHDTPMHDGAVMISEGRIAAAGCFLPLSEQADIRRSFGTRHRAALGLAEESDAVILIVSEETGAISLAYDANLYYDLSLHNCRRTLRRLLNFSPDSENAEDGVHED